MGTPVKMPDGTVVDMPDNPSPELVARLRKAAAAPVVAKEEHWYDGAVDAAKNLGTGLYKGVASLAAGAGDALAGSRDVTDVLGAAASGKQLQPLDTSMPLSRALNESGYKAKTTGEKYVQAGAQGVGAALSNPTAFARPLVNGAIGLASGLGGEVGDRVAGGDSVVGRLIGAILGGGAAGVATSLKGNAPGLAQETLRDVKPADLAAAKQAMIAAQEQGIPVNLSQAMQKPSNIDSMVNALANSRYGKKVTDQLRNQPQQVAFGMEDQMAALPGATRAPQIVANNMQEAATSVIDNAKKARGQAFKDTLNSGIQKLKDGAAGKTETVKATSAIVDESGRPIVTSTRVPAADMVGSMPESAVSSAHSSLKALAAERPNTGLGEMLSGLADRLKVGDKFITDANQINDVFKDVTARLKSPDLASKGVDAGGAKFMANTINGLRQEFGDKFAPIRDANAVFQAATESTVNPLKKSVVGDIAGRRGALPDVEAVKTRLNSVFDAGTVPGAKSSEILTLEKAVRAIPEAEGKVAGKTAFQDAVKTWMASKVSAASKLDAGRTDPNIAANLETVFRGNDTKAQGFKDMMVGMARSQGLKDDALLPGMEKFMKVVSMASRRPGSVQGLSSQGAQDLAGATAATTHGATTINPLRNVALRWSEALHADAYREMDRLLTSPEGVAMLQKLAKQPVTSPAAQAAVTTFLATQAAADLDQRQVPNE